MKNKWNRFLAVCLCVLFLTGAIPLAIWEQIPTELSGLWIRANAADYSGYCGRGSSSSQTAQNLTWTYDPDTGALTIGGTGEMRDYQNSASSVPWGQYRENITSVTIEDGVTSIGKFAFTHCYYFTSIYLPDSVTWVAYAAFNECRGLTSVRFKAECIMKPTGSGSNYATFDGCINLCTVILGGLAVTQTTLQGFSDKTMIRELILENGVQSVGSNAFSECTNLNSVSIPESVTSIGDNAFFGCFSCASITIPDSVTSIGENAFGGVGNIVYNGSLSGAPWGARWINGYVEGNMVFESSEKQVLIACSNEIQGNATIPDGVTIIGSGAFISCSDLTSVTIPSSVTALCDMAFYNCTNLRNVTIPGSITTIGQNVFYGCENLGCATIQCGVSALSLYMFQNCSALASVFIPSSVSSIPASAFSGCQNLQYIYSDATGCCVEEYATENSKTFQVCSTTAPIDGGNFGDSLSWSFYPYTGTLEITGTGAMPDYANKHVTSGTRAPWIDYRDRIQKITIANGVTRIGTFAFTHCYYFTEIDLPDSVTEVSYAAFNECRGLTTISFNASTCNMCDQGSASADYPSLDGCINLRKLVLRGGDNSSVSTDTFRGISNKSTVLEISLDNTSLTRNGNVYSCFENLQTVTIDRCTLTAIYDRAFAGCANLCSVTIPGGVTSIGYSAFSGCSSLVSVTIPSSVTRIWISAFSGCSSLVSVTIPNSVQNVGASAFSGCSSLASVTIPYGVDFISDNAFSGCSSLVSVTIPNSMQSVGSGAFKGCQGLVSVRYRAECSIASDAFNDCINLHKVILGGTTISSGALSGFSDKTVIQEVVTEDGIQKISSSAFSGCSSLNRISIAATVTIIGDAAFAGTSLETIEIPSSVTSIGTSVFESCTKLRTITVDERNPAYSNDQNGILFNKNKTTLIRCPIACEIPQYTLPGSVTCIDANAFRDCSGLESINLGNHVETIGSSAFSGCSNLTSVTIPESVTSIGSNAFLYCNRLVRFSVDENNPQYSSDRYGVLYNKSKTALIQYPAASANTEYKVLNGVTEIRYDAFYSSKNLVAVELPDSVTSIGYSAFEESGLNTVTIPGSVTSIGDSVFENCTALEDVVIMEGTTTIPHYAFSGCTALQIAEIPDSVSSIESYAFRRCNHLTVICSEGSYAQKYCRNILSPTPYRLYDFALVYSQTVYSRPGETVSVPVFVAHNVGFAGFAIFAKYDRSELTPVAVSAGEMLADGTLNDSIGAVDNGVVKCLFASANNQNITENGLLLTLQFESDALADGESVIELFYAQGDTFDEDFQDVTMRCMDTKVQIDPDGEPKLFGTDTQAYAGTDVTVPIYVCGASSMQDCTLQLEYDSSVMELAALLPTQTALSAENMTLQCDAAGLMDGLAFDAVFHILQDAPAGTHSVQIICTDEAVRCSAVSIHIRPDLSPVFEILDQTVFAGETVSVPILLRNNPGLMGSGLYVQFNDQNLSLLSVEKGSVLTQGLFDYHLDEDESILHIVWCGTAESDANGTLLTLTFQSSDDSTEETATISVTPDEANTFNEYWKSVTVESCSAQISIVRKDKLGDASEDGSVDLKDVTVITRWLAGGWDVTINETNADVNHDGEINLKDAVLIRRFLAGGWGVVLQ